MNIKKSVNEGKGIGVLTAHAREKDDKKISRRGADANEGMSIEQGRKGKGWEGREGRINLGPFVSIVEGRRLRMSYRALSPSLGDQEFPMQQLLFLPESGWGCRQKGDLSFIWRLLPLGMRAQVRGRAVWVQVWSLQGTNTTSTTCLLFSLEFA